MAGWTRNELAAYLAGWVESDGNIGICKNGVKAKTYRIRVSLFNNNVKPLLFIQENFGGTIHYREPSPNRLAKMRQYTLVWQAKKGSNVLKEIVPYLIGKKKQAELAIEMYERNKEYGFNGHADRSWQDEFYFKMKNYNRIFTGELQ